MKERALWALGHPGQGQVAGGVVWVCPECDDSKGAVGWCGESWGREVGETTEETGRSGRAWGVHVRIGACPAVSQETWESLGLGDAACLFTKTPLAAVGRAAEEGRRG